MQQVSQEEPTTLRWSALVGYDQMSLDVANLLQNNQFPQVCLFFGREGIGKSIFARKIAAMYFCPTGDACGHCQTCQSIANGQHRDIFHIDPENSTIKLLEAEKGANHLASFPTQEGPLGKHRILIISDIDRLTDQALNRLLKTIEEPPPSSSIILTSSRIKLVRPTLLSRANRWRVKPPRLDALRDWIKSERPNSNVSDKLQDQSIRFLIKESGASPARILEILAEEDTPQAQIDEALTQLITATSTQQVLAWSQRLARDLKMTPADLVMTTERALNRLYWEKAFGTEPNSVKPGVCRKRRQLLSQLKLNACHQQITLNAQLSAEALGMCAIEAGC